MVADTLIALTNCAKTAAVDGIDSVDRDLRLRALAIAQLISVERHYFKTDTANPFSKATSLMFDPRLLVYEYSQSIVLRKRQVELTRDFVATAENGGGHLVGVGKTHAAMAERPHVALEIALLRRVMHVDRVIVGEQDLQLTKRIAFARRLAHIDHRGRSPVDRG